VVQAGRLELKRFVRNGNMHTGERHRPRHTRSFCGVRSLPVEVFCKTRHVYRKLTSALIANQIAAS